MGFVFFITYLILFQVVNAEDGKDEFLPNEGQSITGDHDGDRVKHGDIMFQKGEEEKVFGTDSNDNVLTEQMKDAIKNEARRWKLPVPYVIESSLDRSGVKAVEDAIKEYKGKTCITFRRKSSLDQDYISIKQDTGCWSYVGRIGGKQSLSLGIGCHSRKTAVHELMHALGFWHEQSRPDRDGYVRINFENVLPGREHNFDKKKASDVTDFGHPYDYRSVMHYSKKAFSANGKDTITVIGNPDQELGQPFVGGGLSAIDAKQLNAMYCNDVVTPTTIRTTATTRPTISRRRIPISRRRILISRRRIPISRRRILISRRRIPISRRRIPISRRRILISRRRIPISRRRIPISRRRILISRRRIPISRRRILISRRRIPISRRRISISRRRILISRRRIPIFRRRIIRRRLVGRDVSVRSEVEDRKKKNLDDFRNEMGDGNIVNSDKTSDGKSNAENRDGILNGSEETRSSENVDKKDYEENMDDNDNTVADDDDEKFGRFSDDQELEENLNVEDEEVKENSEGNDNKEIDESLNNDDEEEMDEDLNDGFDDGDTVESSSNDDGDDDDNDDDNDDDDDDDDDDNDDDNDDDDDSGYDDSDGNEEENSENSDEDDDKKN